jgi:hypothetical protein
MGEYIWFNERFEVAWPGSQSATAGREVGDKLFVDFFLCSQLLLHVVGELTLSLKLIRSPEYVLQLPFHFPGEEHGTTCVARARFLDGTDRNAPCLL